MTKDEFKELVSDLCALFPKFARYVDKPNEAKVVVLTAMFNVLQDCEIDDAKEAAQRMIRGTEPKPPAFEEDAWGRHLAGICRKLRAERSQQNAPKRRYVDGKETFACLDCEDSGWVLVFDRKAVVAAERGALGSAKAPNEYVVLCDCRDWGWGGKQTVAVIARGRDVLVDTMVSCSDRYTYLCEQVEQRRYEEPKQASNYTDFGEYGA